MSEEGVGAAFVGFSLVPFTWLFGDLVHPRAWLSPIPESQSCPSSLHWQWQSRNPAWCSKGPCQECCVSPAQDQVPQVALSRVRSQMSPSRGSWMQPVPGVVSLQVWDPLGLGQWDVCSWPQVSQALTAGTGKAGMDQGILSLPGTACGPGQLIPPLFHAFSMAKYKQPPTPQCWGADCWEEAASLWVRQRIGKCPFSIISAGRETFPGTTSSPIPARCPLSPFLRVPLPSGAGISPGLAQSLVWVFHPLPAPCVSELSSPRCILESGISKGKFLHLLHSGGLRSSTSVNSVVVGWG